MLPAIAAITVPYAYSQQTLSKFLPTQVVILQYHHVDNETPPITSIKPDVFLAHMEYLKENHNVVRLRDAIEAIKQNLPLPDNAVAITFDDGYESIFKHAHPILSDFEFPYTVFVNPDSIERLSNQLTWDEVNQMSKLADFANHTLRHIHLLNKAPGESKAQWLNRIMENIAQAEAALEEKVGYSLKWLAYPFGEYNGAVKELLKEAQYIAFAQHSGAVSSHSDFLALPRFPAAGIYANLDTLKVKLKSIAMPVKHREQADKIRELDSELDSFSFSLDDSYPAIIDDINVSQFACYFKGERIIPSLQGMSVNIPLKHRFDTGRVRVNCTAPSKAHNGRFYWHSVAFFTPNEEGLFED
ncbi:polysaccharide deacetylase family protein [Ningiella sp. W23]|uniref:polysaccharide deacetylase family protein n=1 Tax=Ningiella sp. W23 TaxID=3023715 RepID=UPI0037572128